MGPHSGDALSSLFGPQEWAPLELLPFPALVNGVTLGDGGYWRYSFAEQSWDPETGAWVDAVPGRFGEIATGIGLAFEANNRQASPPFFVNQMRPRGIVAGQMVCDFDAPPSALPVVFPPTSGQPVDDAPPGTVRYDVTFIAGGDTVLWLSFGGGVWVAICPCPGFALPSGSGSGSGGGGVPGGVSAPCCTGTLVPGTLYAVISGATNPACNRTIKLKHQDPGNKWSAFEAGEGYAGFGSCDADFSLECYTAGQSPPLTWVLTPGGGTTATPVISECGPPFHLRFAVGDVCGCGAFTTVDILP